MFRGGRGNKLTPHLRSKNPSFGNLQLDQLEFRNFGFPGRSLFRPEHKPFLAQNLCFRTRNLSFSQGSETFVSQPETHLFPRVSLFPPPPPPKPANPRVSKQAFSIIFHLKSNLLNLTLKHAGRIHTHLPVSSSNQMWFALKSPIYFDDFSRISPAPPWLVVGFLPCVACPWGWSLVRSKRSMSFQS